MSADSEEPSDHGAQEIQDAVRQTPLPLLQLFSVSLIQIAEPITALCIYPFINQFIRDTGITGGDERKTGYYGGIIVRTDNLNCVGCLLILSAGIHILSLGKFDCRYLGIFI